MKKKILFAATMFVALLFSACDGGANNPSAQGEKNSEHGMYVGITGFSDNVEFYGSQNHRYMVLTPSNVGTYTSFINSLSMGDATVLYYAVDNNLSYLQNCTFPDDLSSVNIITFTDGLNQGSRALDKQNGNHDYAANDKSYVAEVNRKIKNIKVQGLSINAYAIGIKGKDVSGDAVATFQDNLVQLSSSKDNAMEVSNMDEVSAKFKEIAASLYSKSESTNLTITIPMPSENEKERFTFDNVTDAAASKCYIEGVYANGALTNITYVGCMSNSGKEVPEQAAGGVKIKFEFINFTDEQGKAVSTTYMQQWHMEPGQTTWTRNSEFKPAESIDIKEEHKTAVVMLILDCSSSLGSDFTKVKAAANDFIKTLAGETVDNPGIDNQPHCWEATYTYSGTTITTYVWATEEEMIENARIMNDDPDFSNVSYRLSSANDEYSCEALNEGGWSNTAQVRFAKENDNERVWVMAIGQVDADNNLVQTLAEYEFGTSRGVTSYYDIPAGEHVPVLYYAADTDEDSGWYYALDEHFYSFQPNKKYTYSCGDDGQYLEFTITLDGSINAPAKSKVVARMKIHKSQLGTLRQFRK